MEEIPDKSEVARLLRRVEEGYLMAQRGLGELAAIAERMETLLATRNMTDSADRVALSCISSALADEQIMPEQETTEQKETTKHKETIEHKETTKHKETIEHEETPEMQKEGVS